MARFYRKYLFALLALTTLFATMHSAIPLYSHRSRVPAATGKREVDCRAPLRRVTSALRAAGRLPLRGANWIANIPKRRADHEAARATAYREKAHRPVGTYFRDLQHPTDSEIQTFLQDFAYVYGTFEKIHLPRRGDLRATEVFDKHWKVAGPELLNQPSFLEKHAGKSLESLFLERHFDAVRSEAAKRAAEIRELRYYALRVVGFPFYLLKGAGKMILGESKWTGRLILATILGAAFANVHEPLTANLSTLVNQNLGWLGVQLQMGITRFTAHLEKARAIQGELEDIKQEFKHVQQKYKIRDVSTAEAIKLWENLDETFLNYAKEMRSVIPDNIATGRAYYRDGNFTYPVTFVTSAASINSEKMLHEDVVRTLELKKDLLKTELSDAEQEELAFHKAQIDVSKRAARHCISYVACL